MDLIMIIGAAVVTLIAVVVIAVTATGMLFCGDVMSYTAPGNKTLSPAGASAGKALVAYNPGISGAAKKAAEKIAGDLQSKGYTVDLAGIKSTAAANISGYDVIIAGGPMYWGLVSNSVDTYLKGLKPEKDLALGVFATTGAPEFHDGDIASFAKQVASAPCSGMLNKTAVTKTLRSGDAANIDCARLVSAVLQ
jgi:flavodoxin